MSKTTSAPMDITGITDTKAFQDKFAVWSLQSEFDNVLRAKMDVRRIAHDMVARIDERPGMEFDGSGLQGRLAEWESAERKTRGFVKGMMAGYHACGRADDFETMLNAIYAETFGPKEDEAIAEQEAEFAKLAERRAAWLAENPSNPSKRFELHIPSYW